MNSGYRESGAEALRGATALARLLLRERVQQGGRAVDATCGNGHDTLLLARLVGPAGTVWGFDIQQQALVATAALLADAGCRDQVKLVPAGHERLAEFVTGPVDAAVFNLGYLPGGDKGCTTRPAETLSALSQAIELLAPGGLVCSVLYTGHPGGAAEADGIAEWAARLPPKQYHVWNSRQMNRSPAAPYLIFIEKAS